MKNQFKGFLVLLATWLFYISVVAIPAGFILFLLDPNLFYILVVLAAVLIFFGYRLIIKKYPGFQKLVSDIPEQIPPIPPVG